MAVHRTTDTERLDIMLKRDVLDAFARLDTNTQVSVLTDGGLLDTDAGDATMAHLAGNHQDQYEALVIALARAGY